MPIWKTKLAVVLFGTLLLSSLAPAQAAEPRETLLMNFGWKFYKGELPVNHWGKYGGGLRLLRCVRSVRFPEGRSLLVPSEE